ncbi:S41 family peptidase [Nocardia colli]|uniref:S41 family peptidase n=1 Tax=Nocardia colli TaxID=2545717 RepID=UPI001CC34709|nr:S41 family peptidase [Nocardia colli]
MGAPEFPTGFWQVDDYGSVLAVAADALETYQVTALSCMKDETATRSGNPGRYVTEGKDVLTVRPGDHPDRALLHIDGSPGDRTLRRLAGLPTTCGTEPAAFDVFWQTFQENYPFFAAKDIDWQQVRDRFRDRADLAEQRGDDAELFATLRDMVAPLNDAHVVVSAGDSGFFGTGRPGTTIPGPQLDQQVKEFVQRRDLQHSLTEFANGRIGYADIPGRDYGYLRVSSFSGYTADRTFAADSAELDRALDAIFTADRLGRLRGLVLDLRVNGGGSDSLGLQLAARLTDRPYFAYAKKTRGTEPQPQRVEPARIGFAGPIAILTGGSTVSAGETFTQAMLERPSRTTRIGEPTQGVFSDVMERKLPGARHADWWFGVPNEEFLTSNGRTFDGTGIPPELTEPVFTDEEFAQQRDSAFDRAMQWLTSGA